MLEKYFRLGVDTSSSSNKEGNKSTETQPGKEQLSDSSRSMNVFENEIWDSKKALVREDVVTEFSYSARSGNVEKVVKILAKFNGFESFIPELFNADERGFNPLHYAAGNNHAAVVKEIIKAAEKVPHFMTKLFIENKAPRPFQAAIMNDAFKSIGAFLDFAENDGAFYHLLLISMENKYVPGLSSNPLVDLIAKKQEDIVIRMVNIAKGKQDILEVLFRPNRDGRTVMHSAAAWNSPKVLSALSVAGLGIDQQDNTGNTPLHVASQSQAFDAVETLIKLGARCDIENFHNETFQVSLKAREDGQIKKVQEEQKELERLQAALTSIQNLMQRMQSSSSTAIPPAVSAANVSAEGVANMLDQLKVPAEQIGRSQ